MWSMVVITGLQKDSYVVKGARSGLKVAVEWSGGREVVLKKPLFGQVDVKTTQSGKKPVILKARR